MEDHLAKPVKKSMAKTAYKMANNPRTAKFVENGRCAAQKKKAIGKARSIKINKGIAAQYSHMKSRSGSNNDTDGSSRLGGRLDDATNVRVRRHSVGR